MRKLIILSILFLTILITTGCYNRIKKTNDYIKITRIDTVISLPGFKPETITIDLLKNTFDTTFYKGENVTAKVYFKSVPRGTKNKIIVEVKGKDKEIPVSMEITEETKTKTVELEKDNFFKYIVLGFAILLFMILFTKK